MYAFACYSRCAERPAWRCTLAAAACLCAPWADAISVNATPRIQRRPDEPRQERRAWLQGPPEDTSHLFLALERLVAWFQDSQPTLFPKHLRANFASRVLTRQLRSEIAKARRRHFSLHSL